MVHCSVGRHFVLKDFQYHNWNSSTCHKVRDKNKIRTIKYIVYCMSNIRGNYNLYM